ncbi:MAG: ATP-binding protein [Promethearchaeota archaeon]
MMNLIQLVRSFRSFRASQVPVKDNPIPKNVGTVIELLESKVVVSMDGKLVVFPLTSPLEILELQDRVIIDENRSKILYKVPPILKGMELLRARTLDIVLIIRSYFSSRLSRFSRAAREAARSDRAAQKSAARAAKKSERNNHVPTTVGTVVELLDSQVIVNIRDTPIAFPISSVIEPLAPKDRVLIDEKRAMIVKKIASVSDSPPGTLYEPNLGFPYPCTFNDIGGLKSVKERIRDEFILPMKNPEQTKQFHFDPLQGILLSGPPGCGKTMLASAIAHQADLPLLVVTGSDIICSLVGESAQNLSKLFRYCRAHAPIILFLDEIESLSPHRGQNRESGEIDRMFTQLLQELDGISTKKTPLAPKVYLIGATNRKNLVDPALLRPGRLNLIIEIPLPNQDERGAILEGFLDGISHDLNLLEMTLESDGFSGADLFEVIRGTKLQAIKLKADSLTMVHFQSALKSFTQGRNIKPSVFGQNPFSYPQNSNSLQENGVFDVAQKQSNQQIFWKHFRKYFAQK